jgi:carbonic anhydrase
MNTIDYIYRFDPKNPSLKPSPPDAETARTTLEDGNRMFAKWMQSCRTSKVSAGESCYVVQCNGLEVGMKRAIGETPEQAPFAVVVGCSDARVPTEMLFGQGFNDLFVIRVAGNVLGDVCMGSIEFALTALSDSVKVVVMLGHSGCGAVTGAVDCYLRPHEFWSKSFPPMLKTILQRIFVAVREGANGLREVWGPDARQVPGYREALIDIAVCVNAAQAAFDLRQEVERAAKWEIEVLYGVFSLHNHQVSMPVNPRAPVAPENVNLANAPTNPSEFSTIALQMAELLKPASLWPNGRPGSGDGSQTGNRAAANPRKVADPIRHELLLRPDDHLGKG